MMKPKIKSLLALGFIVQTLILSTSAQSGVVFTNLYSFTGGNDGAIPTAALVQGSDGNFYGTTSNGGTNGAGTVFEISSNGALTLSGTPAAPGTYSLTITARNSVGSVTQAFTLTVS